MCDLRTPSIIIQGLYLGACFHYFTNVYFMHWRMKCLAFHSFRRPHSMRSKPNPVKPEPFLSFWQMKKEKKKEMNYQYTSFNLYNFCFIWHFLGWWYLKKFKKTHNSCVKYDTVGVMGLKLLSGVCDHVNSTCNLTMATLLVMWSLLSASVTCSSLFRGFAACRQGSA